MEQEHAVWESDVVYLDAIGREGTIYRLASGVGKFPMPSGREKIALDMFCHSADQYVRLDKPQCNGMGIFKKVPLYVSITFLDGFMNCDGGIYHWHLYRTRSNEEKTIDPEKNDKYEISHPTRVAALDFEVWKSMLRDQYLSKNRKYALLERYRVPARDEKGVPMFVELAPKFRAMASSVFWESLYRGGTSVWKFGNWNAAFRGLDPDNTTMYILPYAIIGNNTPEVTWGDVDAAFRKLPSDLKTKYIVVKSYNDVKGMTLHSVNPFGHYMSYLPKGAAKELGTASFRPLPSYNKKTGDKLKYTMRPTETDFAMQRKLEKAGINITNNAREGTFSLSTKRMLTAIGKRKETDSQETVMGISAPTLAKGLLGWDSCDDQSTGIQVKHTAEWLHICAFAFGGLVEITDAWETSQVQLNMMFGTWETNSCMLRLEAAWQKLFVLERAYRKKAGDKAQVTGTLDYTSVPPASGYDVQGHNAEKWKPWYGNCPWIHFELQWKLSMNERSHLLNWDNPSVWTAFLPFERSFFTKGEAMVDVALIETVFDRKVEKLALPVPRGKTQKKTQGLVQITQTVQLKPPEWIRVEETEQLEVEELTQDMALTNIEHSLTLADNINRLESHDHLRCYCIGHRESMVADSEPSPRFNSIVASTDMKASDFVDRKPSKIQDSASTKGDTLVVGGLPLRNTSLVVCDDDGKYADLPITIRAVDSPATEVGLLLTPATADDQESTVVPIFLVSSSSRNDVSVVGSPLTRGSEVVSLVTQAFTEANTSTVPNYVLQGDVRSLFGIPGLTGKLSTFQSADFDQPIKEMVTPDLGGFVDGPIARLFPFIDSDIIQRLPIENVKFVYSEAVDEFLNPSGLSLNADITFTGPLQPINDLLGYVFSGSNDTPPSKLQVSARLSVERDWSLPLDFSNLAIRGSFDMSLWLGDIINFRKIGIEVSIMSSLQSGIAQRRWDMGYGLFGELDIWNIPGTVLPLTVRYHMRKLGTMYITRMALCSEEWKSVFGITKLNVTEVEFNIVFDTTKLSDSFTIGVSAIMQLGEANIFLSGQYSKAETYLEAEIGNMTWDQVVGAYNQLMGEPVDNVNHDHDIKFEHISIRISTDGISLSGKVSFNGKTSVHGYVKFDENGLAIGGGIESFKVPSTEIEIQEAGLDIFVGSKGSIKGGGRVTKFALKGVVHFQGIKIAAGLQTSTEGPSSSRRWIMYGSYEGDLQLSSLEAARELKAHPDLDMALRNVAVIASNKKGVWVNPLIKIKYPVSEGISLFALIEPLPAINQLANNKKVDGLMLIASVSTKQLSVAIQLPEAISIKMGSIAEIGSFAVSLHVSSNPNLMLGCDIKINMEKQPPLVLHANIAAGLTAAAGQIYLEPEVPWKNPFGLSDQVEVRKLGGRIEFEYATVFATGPSALSFIGAAKCGDFTVKAVILVSNNPARQVLKLDITGLNVAQLIRFAGEMADLDALRNIEGGDFLIFNKAGMYLSTGVEDLYENSYPAGISANGDVTVFGKRANFNASLGSDGFELLGEVDAFKIGPLEVRSASGKPRAKLEIAMTSQKQLVEIDGVIIIGGSSGLEIGALIKASLTPVVFDVWVFIRFTDQIKFDLRAVAENVSNYKDLSQANVKFSLTLDGDVLEAFCNGILKFLDELQNLATASTEALEWGLQKRLEEVSREASAKTQRLDALKARITAERQTRANLIAEAEDNRQRAQRELDELRNARYTTLQEKENAERQVRERLKQAEVERTAVELKKRQEYQSKLNSAENDRRRYQDEKNQLEGQKKFSYGDIMTTLKDVTNKLRELQPELDHAKEVSARRKENLPNLGFFDRVSENAAIQIFDKSVSILSDQARDAEQKIKILQLALDNPAFHDLEFKIDLSVTDYNKAYNVVAGLRNGGVEGFIKAAMEDEDAKVQRRRRELDAMLNQNSEYMKAVREAQAKLDAREPKLLAIIAEEDEKIKQAEENMQIRELEEQLKSVREDEEDKRRQKEAIMAGANMIRGKVKEGTEEARKLVQEVKGIEIKIKSVAITADGKELVQGGPMVFRVAVEYEGKMVMLEEKWSPLQKPAALYRDIMTGLLGF